MKPTQLSLDLVAQSNAVAIAAQEASFAQQVVLEAGSRTLANAARREAAKAKAKAAEPAVIELDAAATPAAVSAARARRAVRKGRDVFLPIWSDYAVGLPNALLRSSLWIAGEASEVWMEAAPIATLGKEVSMLYTGRQLTQFDRRVFAACLEYYKEGRPLSAGGASPYVCTSFFQFAQGMGLAYSLKLHVSLRASLVRLEAAALRVRIGELELPVPRLIEVAFADGYQTCPDKDLKGADSLAFRVQEQLAELYGPSAWTAVPKAALDQKGIKAWLLTFYATHKSAKQLPFKTLQSLSGMTCRPNDFRACFVRALDSLSGADAPAEVRVESYEVSADKKSISVKFARWK